MLVGQVMTPDPVTVRARTPVKAALRLLDEHDISSMPVVDGTGRVCGVVSEADLIRELVSPDQRLHELRIDDPPPPHRFVDEVMSPHAITVSPDTDLSEAVELVTSTGIKCLPVVDERTRVLGVVSRRDVVRVLAREDEALEQEVDALFVAAGMRDWLVDVQDGVAAINGPGTERERRVAKALARAVPGVVSVTVD